MPLPKPKAAVAPPPKRSPAPLVLLLAMLYLLNQGGVIPSPIEGPGLRVLIVEETAERGSLAPGQREAILSTTVGSVHELLNKNCIKVDGVPEWRILDKDQPDGLARESKAWQELWTRERKSIPWLVVANGSIRYEGPLPKTAEETFNIISRYK